MVLLTTYRFSRSVRTGLLALLVGMSVSWSQSLAATSADPFGKWTVRHVNSAPVSASLKWVSKLVIGNGLYVALDPGSTADCDVFHSNKDLRWLPSDGSLPTTTRDIAFGNGVFVAVGAYDKIYTSSDATAWTARSLPTPSQGLSTCSFANGLFICYSAASGIIYTSKDATAWADARATMPGPPGNIIYGNGIYLSTDRAGWIYTSTNIIQWTSANAYSPAPPVFAMGKFYTPDASSADGRNWTGINTFGAVRSIAYEESSHTLVCVGSWEVSTGAWNIVLPLLVTSTDGENWTRRSALFGVGLEFVAAGEGRLMAGGRVGNFLGPYITTGVSEDGIAWRHGEAALPNLNAVASGPAGFVAVGNNGALFHSKDGVDWESIEGLPNHHLFNVCQANGTYVAVGEAGLLLVSQNGRDWIRKATDTSLHLYGVTYGAGKFVVVGGYWQHPYNPIVWPELSASVSLYSTNGVQWQTGSTNALDWIPYSVAWDGRRFVASGLMSGFGNQPGPGVWTYASTNGVSDWVKVDMTGSPILDARRLESGNGRIAFASDDDQGATRSVGLGIMTNLDRKPATYSAAVTAATTAIGFGNGLFVAMSATNAWASADGLAWRSYDLPTSVPLYDVAYGDGVYVAVGANQTIIQSSLLAGSGLQLGSPSSTGAGRSIAIPSQTGLKYFLEVKDSLSDLSWQPLPSVPGTGSPLLLQDNSPPTATRFYRVRVE